MEYESPKTAAARRNDPKINVDENPDIAVEYNVMSIPTLIVFKNGKEEKRLVGLRNKEELINLF